MEFELSREFLDKQIQGHFARFVRACASFSRRGVQHITESDIHIALRKSTADGRLTYLTVTQVLHTGHCSGSSGVTLDAATAAGGVAATQCAGRFSFST